MNYTYQNLTSEQVEGYLTRMGLTDLVGSELRPTKELLDRLVYTHQMTIPFDSIDVYLKHTPMSLALTDIYQKVVVDHRGGYCFELNTLFVSLLRTLGFDAVSCLCRVVRGMDVVRAVSHCGSLVRLSEGIGFCDVGFGGPMPAGVLLMENGIHQLINGEEFWAEDTGDGWWALMRRRKGALDDYEPGKEAGICLELMVQKAAADPMDYQPLNIAVGVNQNIIFHQNFMANIRKADGYCNINNMTYTEKTGEKVIRIVMADEEQRAAILRDKFGIVIA